MAIIKFDNVSKRYANGHEALQNLNFHLNRGEMAFLTGHSGAGKSTVLKLVGMMEKATRGQIIVDGIDVGRIARGQVPLLRRHIGYIFQQPKLLTDRTVFDNVALPLIIDGAHPREVGKRVRAALDKVGLLTKERMHPEALSSGEQQRVGIARAIVNKPPILLADEPTGNLDPKLSREIMQLFQDFNQVGVALLIASHDLSLIATLKHRILTLKNGILVNDGL